MPSSNNIPDPGPVTGERPLRFEVSENVARDEWQAIADASHCATFFHTPAWLGIFARANPATRIRTRIFRFEDGKRAVFPLLEHRRLGGLYTTAVSSAASCYGGWISGDALTADHAVAIARSMHAGFRNLVWRVSPIDPFSSLLDRWTTTPDTTEVLDLEGIADEDALRARFRHSARKQIAKGCRAGLSARVSEKWEEWEEYYRIYEARMQQWGKDTHSRHSIAFFRTVHEAQGPNVKLWTVLRDGKVVGGNLNFYHGRHCVEWHAAYDCTLFACGVRDFLVDQIIRDAWARGFAWYDFNPSAGYEGTRRFKQTFGTTSRPCNLIVWRRGLYRLESARRALRAVQDLRQREEGSNGAANGASNGAESPAPVSN